MGFDIIISSLTLIVASVTLLITILNNKFNNKFLRTSEAYNDFYSDVIQKLYEYGFSEWKKHNNSDPEYKVFTQYLHRIENFCACVNIGVYDYDTLCKISGLDIHYLYTKTLSVRDVISKSKTYYNFRILNEKICLSNNIDPASISEE